MPPAYCNQRWNQRAGLPPHPSPKWECKCGYYSLKPECLIRASDWPRGSWTPKSMIDFGIVGWVDSWGSIIETEWGYRSEHIKIDSFIMFDLDWVLRSYIRTTHAGKLWTDEGWQAMLEERLFEYGLRVGMFADRFDVPVVMYG